MLPTILVPLALLCAQDVTGAPAASRPAGSSIATGFLFKTIQVDDEKFNYCVYVPPEYTPDKSWPIVLFLHGSGERGSDGFLQTDVGIARAIRREKTRCPGIVVMPQARRNESWTGPMAAMALKCVERTSSEYKIDPQRVYLTGISLGGQGVWAIASRFPDKFAAIVPICGFVELKEQSPQAVEQLAAKVAKMPCWCFHGDADPNVPVERTRSIVEALRRAGSNVEYTEIKGGRHDVWDQVYADTKVWIWMFKQRLP